MSRPTLTDVAMASAITCWLLGVLLCAAGWFFGTVAITGVGVCLFGLGILAAIVGVWALALS